MPDDADRVLNRGQSALVVGELVRQTHRRRRGQQQRPDRRHDLTVAIETTRRAARGFRAAEAQARRDGDEMRYRRLRGMAAAVLAERKKLRRMLETTR